MAGGVFVPGEDKVRPGLYINFVSRAQATVKGGSQGIVAMPVKADWGPVKSFVQIENEAQLKEIFTDSQNPGVTAYFSISQALIGGAQKVLAYRLADGNEAKATVNLKDTAGTPLDVVKLTAKYHGERGNKFRVTISTNLVDPNKRDIKLYENATLLMTVTAPSADPQDVVDAINNAPENKYVDATKLADGNGEVATVTSAAFSGGNSGISGITAQQYVDALTAFEAQDWNVFVLDGVSDPAIQETVKEYIKRLRDEGKKVMLVIGGDAQADADPAQGNQRSKDADHEGIVNLITGVYIDGKAYSSAEFAPRIAGVIAGTPLNKSITYAVLPGVDDVTRRYTTNEAKTAIQSGSLILIHDGEKVKIEKGINTLTTYTDTKGPRFSKIRVIRTLDAINNDLTKTANDSYIGKINNNIDGQKALVSAIRAYLEQLAAQGVINNNFVADLDPNQPSVDDKVFLQVAVQPVDSMELIYMTVTVE